MSDAADPGAPTEPVVDIRPPRWFAAVSVVAAMVFGLLGAVASISKLAAGDPVGAAAGLLAGAGLAVLAYDVSTRRATSYGDELVLHQWYRTVTLQREDVREFAAARASFVRWDIVAVLVDGVQTRLWVTRMLPASRSRRQGWLGDLEAWRTWIGGPGSAWPSAR